MNDQAPDKDGVRDKRFALGAATAALANAIEKFRGAKVKKKRLDCGLILIKTS